MTTPFHAKYWASLLTLQGVADSVDGLSRALANARVDLNPHQVDAALFALSSPLTGGIVLADEVGLGKTIEAALVIAQRWAERRRRIVVVVPAVLRKQWQAELADKFFLPAEVLETTSWSRRVAEGHANPFEVADRIVVVSYHFAARHADCLAAVSWDLVVLDEAHRLRNAYRAETGVARAVCDAVRDRPKLLLTATPLQNSLLELYGLVSAADSRVFGDPETFREQFVKEADPELRNSRLRERLHGICHRTLRRQVLEYVSFTRRVSLTQQFSPTDAEQTLYEGVSDYLRRDALAALPGGQRGLITMVLRKLLASSSFAIARTLRALAERLRAKRRGEAEAIDAAGLGVDFETLDAIEDEWTEAPSAAAGASGFTLDDEIATLDGLAAMASSIRDNSKGDALVRALEEAFARTATVGAPRKAVVFTESRRTQEYLFELLTGGPYAGEVVLLNGSNTDALSRSVHDDWSRRHAADGLATGSRPVDTRAAIIEAFRDRASILIATEAAAEGVNLQFCALVVNYDLPWNPQRVEQRIGRCHRYGQAHDVVVVNFLNARNAADRRVYELLAEKFQLFDGVFGASDEVLGALESGVDVERRIAEAYRTCRTEEEIDGAFVRLREELDAQIRERMEATRSAVLEHFDEEVHGRLRVHKDAAVASLDARGRWLLALTRYELGVDQAWDLSEARFAYSGPLGPGGTYHFDWREAERQNEIFYRVDHPLAQVLVGRALSRATEPACVIFDYAGHGVTAAAIEPLVGKAGWLWASRMIVSSLETDECLVLAGRTDEGERLDDEACRRLFSLDAGVSADVAGPAPDAGADRAVEVSRHLERVEARNRRHFDSAVTRLDRWTDDLKLGLEREIREIDARIRETQRLSATAISLEDKLGAQRSLRVLEQSRNRKRRELFDAQDQIDAERVQLIDGLERQLATTHETTELFALRWTVR